MTYAEAHEAARKFSVEQGRTAYVIAHPEREGFEFCALSDWSDLHAQGWRYVEMVAEESAPLDTSPHYVSYEIGPGEHVSRLPFQIRCF